MKIGLFSDSHYSSQEVTCGRRFNSRSLEKVRRALEDFRAQGCEMVLCLGDLIDREDDHDTERKNLARMAMVIREGGLPFVAVMGNHDAFAFTAEEFYAVLGEEMRPQDGKYGNKTLIFLDACHFADGTHYAPGDEDWMNTCYPHEDLLKEKLAAASAEIVVLLHQNIDPNIHPSHCLSNASRIRRILHESGKVSCVVQGHFHDGAENIVQGIRYLTLPAMCERENAVFTMEI